MEQYLRSYVNYLQDDWAERMPLAEFAANNQASETTGISPFFANYGYDPRWTDDLQHNVTDELQRAADEPQRAGGELQRAADNSPKARAGRNHAETMKEINEHLRSEMLRAQQRYQDAANARRLPEPIFKIRDLVWLDAKNITT